MDYQRLKKIQSRLTHPLLIKKKENLFYLTGQVFDHRAEEYLLITKNGAVGFGSGLEQIDWIKKSDQLGNIGKYIEPKSQLNIEYGFTYGEGKYLKFKLPKVKISPSRSSVDIVRQTKDSSELVAVHKSMQIVEKVFTEVKAELKKKTWTEIKLAEFIIARGYKHGAEDVSFPAIVASGSNAAIPHHVPGNKMLKAGESIIIDFGYKYKNYCSDFTRTVFLKSAPKKLAESYEKVEQAYNQSISFCGKGVIAGDVYQKSASILAEKNLDKYFIHSLGHGTGLEIHELPNLSPKSNDIITDGMVFSIEPGVYFPKLGGIRIEDLVYMESGKCKKFINVPTALKENII